MDGGVWGTLRRCPTCEEGFLHEPDPPRSRKIRRSPSRPTVLQRVVSDLIRNLVENSVSPARPTRPDYRPRPAFGVKAQTHVELKTVEPQPVEDEKLTIEIPAEHVVLESKEEKKDEHVEIKVTDESPETLEVDATLKKYKNYKAGDTVKTHKAEYVVDSIRGNVMYLIRKDIWEERNKLKHVVLESKDEEKDEHVVLESKDDGDAGHVVLNFD
jgi:hypothetical protein